MCDKCKPLIGCRAGFTVRVKLTEFNEMALEHRGDNFDAFVNLVDVDPHDGQFFNYRFYIKHCPFCGEKIEPDTQNCMVPLEEVK